jgi:hypothetical protein
MEVTTQQTRQPSSHRGQCQCQRQRQYQVRRPLTSGRLCSCRASRSALCSRKVLAASAPPGASKRLLASRAASARGSECRNKCCSRSSAASLWTIEREWSGVTTERRRKNQKQETHTQQQQRLVYERKTDRQTCMYRVTSNKAEHSTSQHSTAHLSLTSTHSTQDCRFSKCCCGSVLSTEQSRAEQSRAEKHT